MAAVKQRLEEEEEEESQSNEYSGASEDGEGASSHVEAVAEELARKVVGRKGALALAICTYHLVSYAHSSEMGDIGLSAWL